MTLAVPIRRLPHGADLPPPAYASAGAAGLDLVAAVPDGSVLVLEPGARDLVPTGIAIAVPEGWEAQVRPRSGLALRHGVTTLNTPGTIDSDYRGEIGVVLINHGRVPFDIRRGLRIAQLVFARVQRIAWADVDDLDATTRGAGGFGSTGLESVPQP